LAQTGALAPEELIFDIAMTLLALYLLASLDGLLCGCRAFMGRCPLIHTRSYYLRALWHGLLAAQFASLVSLLLLLLVVAFSAHRAELRTDLESTAGRMLWVFVPYSATVLVSLTFRLVPSTDVRSATSVFALGPLTAIRPLITIAGVLVGIYSSHLRETRALGLFVLALMLSLESVLNHLASRRQSRQIQTLV